MDRVPGFFGSVASTLAVPLFLAALGIILRGACYALRAGGRAPASAARSMGSFAFASMLTPFVLGQRSGGDRLRPRPRRQRRGRPAHQLAQPDLDMIGAAGGGLSAFLAAVYLAADAAGIGDGGLVEAFRRGPGHRGRRRRLALAGLLVVHSDAHPLYTGLSTAPRSRS